MRSQDIINVIPIALNNSAFIGQDFKFKLHSGIDSLKYTDKFGKGGTCTALYLNQMLLPDDRAGIRKT